MNKCVPKISTIKTLKQGSRQTVLRFHNLLKHVLHMPLNVSSYKAIVNYSLFLNLFTDDEIFSLTKTRIFPEKLTEGESL